MHVNTHANTRKSADTFCKASTGEQYAIAHYRRKLYIGIAPESE